MTPPVPPPPSLGPSLCRLSAAVPLTTPLFALLQVDVTVDGVESSGHHAAADKVEVV